MDASAPEYELIGLSKRCLDNVANSRPAIQEVLQELKELKRRIPDELLEKDKFSLMRMAAMGQAAMGQATTSEVRWERVERRVERRWREEVRRWGEGREWGGWREEGRRWGEGREWGGWRGGKKEVGREGEDG